MKVVAFLTQKGGSGKTTLASSMSVAAQEVGEKVVALDLDPQGSLAQWGEDREGGGLHVEAFPASKIIQIESILKSLEGRFSLAILDTAGADNAATSWVLKVADYVLVPIQPTRLDVRAIKPTVQKLLVSERPFAFVINRCPPQPNNNRAFDMFDGLKSISDVALPLILQRADYQDAYTAGKGVTEHAPTGKAAGEMRELWNWVRKRV